MRGVALTTVAATLLAIAGPSPAAADAAAAPANTARPVLSGTSMDGRTITTSNGSWTGTPPLSFSYRWLRCDSTGASCVTLSASGQSYNPTASDVGLRLASIVTATNV